jgi:hypothetical protein
MFIIIYIFLFSIYFTKKYLELLDSWNYVLI